MPAMRQLPAAALLLAALALSASSAGAKPWKNSAELSYHSANGNTKTQMTAAKNALTYDVSAETKAEVEVGGRGARTDRQTQAEQYYALEKVSRKFSDRSYVFERFRWDRDLFAGIRHRNDFSVGVGRELWKTSKDLLIGELAPGYANEERVSDNHKSYASARAYAKYSHEFSETAKFSQDIEYVLSLADSRDTRVNTETALIANLSSVLAMKNSFVWKHDSRPAARKRKDDTILSLAMIATF